MDYLRGVIAVAVTPFDSAGRLDEAAYRAVISRLAVGGVDAVTANGNTGEFYALGDAEAGRAVELAGRRHRVHLGAGGDRPAAVHRPATPVAYQRQRRRHEDVAAAAAAGGAARP